MMDQGPRHRFQVRPVRAVLLVVLLVAGCSLDRSEEVGTASSATTEPVDTTDTREREQTTEEMEERRQEAASTDLELVIDGPASPAVAGPLDYALGVSDIGSSYAEIAVVRLAHSAALVLSGPRAACSVVDAETTECRAADDLLAGSSAELVVTFDASHASGDVTVEGTVTSEDNPLDNDPDPTNNTASVTTTIR